MVPAGRNDATQGGGIPSFGAAHWKFVTYRTKSPIGFPGTKPPAIRPGGLASGRDDHSSQYVPGTNPTARLAGRARAGNRGREVSPADKVVRGVPRFRIPGEALHSTSRGLSWERPGSGARGWKEATMKGQTGRILAVLMVMAVPARAGEWYVAPEGKENGRGPRRRPGTSPPPWEEAAARSGRGIRSGSARARITRPPRSAGTATRCGSSAGRGTPSASVPCPAARATIDGGLNILPPATYVEIRDLEITVSEPRPAAPVPPDPTYRNVNRPWGGLNVNTGTGCKFINLVIHDNSQGVSWWSGIQGRRALRLPDLRQRLGGHRPGPRPRHLHPERRRDQDDRRLHHDGRPRLHPARLRLVAGRRRQLPRRRQHRLRGEHVPHRRRQAEPPHPRARQRPARRRRCSSATRHPGTRTARCATTSSSTRA